MSSRGIVTVMCRWQARARLDRNFQVQFLFFFRLRLLLVRLLRGELVAGSLLGRSGIGIIVLLRI